MKKQVAVFIIVAMLAAIPLAVSADVPAPGGPFNAAFRIQNLGTEAAYCAFKFYDAAGVEKYSSGVLPAIAVGDAAYIYVPNDTTVADGQYAGVVECDQPVAAVLNFSDADSGASYSGVTEPGPILYAPGIYDNYYDYYSNIVVQNASDSAQTITVEIYEPGNTTPVKIQTAANVAKNGYASFEQEGLAELADDQFYSAKIKGASGDVAAIVNIYGRGGTDNQLYSYNPFSAGATVGYAPVILNNYYGYNSALVIQNLSETTAATVVITYSDGTIKNATIQPGASDSRYTPFEGLPDGVDGLHAAKVECTNGQPIVVLVNESNDYNRAASYSGFASGTKTVRAPIVMRRYYKWNTSVTCQNVGTGPATMSIQYSGITGSTASPSIPVNGKHIFYQPTDPLVTADNWIGSATITSAQDIVCIINEDQNEAPEMTQSMDQLYAYNGIGQ
jgi:hypothetical protein